MRRIRGRPAGWYGTCHHGASTATTQGTRPLIKRKETRLMRLHTFVPVVSILALAAAAAPGAEPQPHCENQPKVRVINIDETFASHARWRFEVFREQCEGLTFERAFYTPAGGVEREVLHRASIAQIHVRYLPGSPVFFDVTHATEGLGDTNADNAHPRPPQCRDASGNLIPGCAENALAVPLQDAECPEGVLWDDGRVCVIKHFMAPDLSAHEGYAWKDGALFRVTENIEVFMSSQLGAYNYINKWQFRDDGTIEPSLGLTGSLQQVESGPGSSRFLPRGSRLDDPRVNQNPVVGISHLHNIYYRLDFDIAGPGNDAVARMSFQPQTSTHGLVPLNREAAQVVNPTEFSSWVVFDKVVTNNDTRPIGYEIIPHIAGLWRGASPPAEGGWDKADLWVTRFHPCEIFATNNHVPHIPASTCSANNIPRTVGTMVGGESINGADVVVWYANRILHIPRDEEFGTPTHPHGPMPIEWTSFEIRPRSFFHTNPGIDPTRVPGSE
jgi:primary-amine oxidase